MTLTMNRDEAEVLIAVLLWAEMAAEIENAAMTAAIATLRPMRSRLLETYVRDQHVTPLDVLLPPTTTKGGLNP